MTSKDSTIRPASLSNSDQSGALLLILIPSTLVVIFTPVYIYHNLRRVLHAQNGSRPWWKLITAVALLATEIQSCTLSQLPPDKLQIVATCIYLGFVCLVVLLYLEHQQVFRPSGLLAACLFVHVIFDVVKAQSMLSHLYTITPTLVAASFQKMILILLETGFLETSETQADSALRQRELPIQQRFKLNGRYQKVEDLPALDDDIAIKQLRDKLIVAWDTVDREGRYCLQLASFLAFPQLFLHALFLRTCLTAAVFSQPLLMKYVLHVAEIEDISLDTTATIFALTILVFGGVASPYKISRSYFTYSTTRLSLSVRGAVSAIAAEKVMLLQSSSDESSSAVIILSNNLHALETHVERGIGLVGVVVDTITGLVLLYNLIGPSSLVSIIPLIIHLFCIKERNPTARLLYQERDAASESWILSMSQAFSQLKDMKMAGSISAALLSVKTLFATATNRHKDTTDFWTTGHMLHAFLESCVPLIVLGTSFMPKISDKVAGSNTFPSLALATLLVVPMMQLQTMYPEFFATLSRIHRIREFLLFPERVEYRVFKNTAQHREKHKVLNINEEAESPNQCPDYITFSGLCVSSRDELNESLQNIEGQIRQSQLSMVIGPVGWGKSTLLKAILGEANQVRGSVILPQNHRIAYCGQTPWLPNTTIRKAIIGAHIFDAVRYHRMVQACDLKRDLELLESGDESLTGSGGTLLSGGQKQRISLARALYADTPIVVLDDIFSALDRVTARRIFGRLFSKDGLLRRSQVTTVMSTHAIEYLSEADQIFLIGPHGTLQSHGNFFDIEATPAATEAILHSENFATDEADWDTGDSHNQLAAHKSHVTALANPNENRPPATTDWSVYHFFIQFVPHRDLLVHFIFSIAVVIMEAIPAIFALFWIGDNMASSSYFLVYAASVIVHPIFHVGMYKYYLGAKRITRQRLFTRLISIVLQADIASLTRLDRGTLISRFVEDLALTGTAIDNIMIAWFSCIATLIDIALLSLLDTAFAMALPLFLLMLLIIRTRYVGVSRQLMLLNLESKAAVYTQVTEVISGLTYLRAFQWQPYFAHASFEKLEAWQKTSYFACSVQRWCILSLELVILAAALLVVNFATSTSSAKPHTAAIATAMFILMNMSLKLSRVVGSWVGLEMDMSGLSRIQTFIETTTTEPDWQDGEDQIPATWPSQGSVELLGVSAGYRAFGGEVQPILKDISFKLRPGNRIGIVGRTGSGKTSLALTILNSLPFEGQLKIDNVDVSNLPPETVRRRITIITQNPVELLGTVRDNLMPSQDDIEWKGRADDVAINDALRRVGLSKYIEEHGGLDALFSDMDFSQGQKQLICLARAILHNSVTGSKLVIIDEATSSMDYDTDSDMQKVISDSFAGCTIIVIAHRVESLKNVDYLLELEDGRQVSLIPCSERARLLEVTDHTN